MSGERQGKLWEPDEERQLLVDFDNGLALEDLVERFGRSEAAITTRLIRLERLARSPSTGRFHKLDPEPWT